VTEAARQPIVHLEGLSRTFVDGEKRRKVLDGLELRVDPGELVAIVGASGSGKTTLLNVMGALDASFEGKASIFGRSLGSLDDDGRASLRNQLVGFVFQSFHLLEHLSVIDNVKLPLWLARESVRDEDELALRALSEVGLGDRARDRVGPLSGGERQRVAIARALAPSPRLILADEPTGNLDEATGASIFALFDAIRRRSDEGRAVVIVTHDPRVAPRADRVLSLAGGKLVEDASFGAAR
jgi:predicted ABC-type transport system involved in lysophospholipase L1 biosynthesis ATPase subunit